MEVARRIAALAAAASSRIAVIRSGWPLLQVYPSTEATSGRENPSKPPAQEQARHATSAGSWSRAGALQSLL